MLVHTSVRMSIARICGTVSSGPGSRFTQLGRKIPTNRFSPGREVRIWMKVGRNCGSFEHSVYRMDLRRLSADRRPCSMPLMMLPKLSSRRMMSAASFATSVPRMPIAMPTSACFRAGASFTPSPVMAQIAPVIFFRLRSPTCSANGLGRSFEEDFSIVPPRGDGGFPKMWTRTLSRTRNAPRFAYFSMKWFSALFSMLASVDSSSRYAFWYISSPPNVWYARTMICLCMGETRANTQHSCVARSQKSMMCAGSSGPKSSPDIGVCSSTISPVITSSVVHSRLGFCLWVKLPCMARPVGCILLFFA
mmetsp:Transcript_4920/g.12269  ORF Transcript_4920/g.12269 Transcript_4920/m.12269 type:complete len:306 (-) Transcript_4920:3334-4251(-)